MYSEEIKRALERASVEAAKEEHEFFEDNKHLLKPADRQLANRIWRRHLERR